MDFISGLIGGASSLFGGGGGGKKKDDGSDPLGLLNSQFSQALFAGNLRAALGSKDNTALYIAGGGAALVVLLLLVKR